MQLNRQQQIALGHYMLDTDGMEENPDRPLEFEVEDGQIKVGGSIYLHSDGEWATFREGCLSCKEGIPRNDCPESHVVCGHHHNDSWEQDFCPWCSKEFGEVTTA